MITPEEMAKFEQIFEEIKYVLLSDSKDKYKTAMNHIVKLVYIKNEGNQHKTAAELGLTPRTTRAYLKGFKANEDLLNLHLNMLTANKWFASLPLPEQDEYVSMVMDYYREDKPELRQ